MSFNTRKEGDIAFCLGNNRKRSSISQEPSLPEAVLHIWVCAGRFLLWKQATPTSQCLIIMGKYVLVLRAKGYLWICWAPLVPRIETEGAAFHDDALLTGNHGEGRTGVNLDSILFLHLCHMLTFCSFIKI